MKSLTCFKSKSILYPLFIFFLVFLYSTNVDAQLEKDTTTIWEIVMKDGSIFKGKIMVKGRKVFHVKTKDLGMLVLVKRNIKHREAYVPEELKDSIFIEPNILSNRMMLSPTGMLQGKRKGYYENKYLFANHFNFGLSNDFSLGFGMMPLFLFDGAATPVWVVPKLKIKTKSKYFKMSTGVFWADLLLDDYSEFGTILIGYGMATVGTDNLNFSIGLGYGYLDYRWLESPTISFSGMVRINKRSYLFCENIFFNVMNNPSFYGEIENLFSIGGRTIWKNVTLDFGFLGPNGRGVGNSNGRETGFIAIPYIGLILPFK